MSPPVYIATVIITVSCQNIRLTLQLVLITVGNSTIKMSFSNGSTTALLPEDKDSFTIAGLTTVAGVLLHPKNQTSCQGLLQQMPR